MTAMSLSDQLYSGVRVLDIRCRRSGDMFTIHHGAVYQYANFNDVLFTVKGFLTVNPSETILMRLKEEYLPSKDTVLSFEQIFLKYYNNPIYQGIFWTGYNNSINESYARSRGSRRVAVSNADVSSAQDPLLRELRGKVVLLDDMPRSTATQTYGIDYGTLVAQDDWYLPGPCELGWKWDRVTAALNASSTEAYGLDKNATRIHVNFLSASGGSFPYFFASGKSSPGTCEPAAPCVCFPATKCDVPGFWRGPLGIKLYKGVNELVYDWPAWDTSSPRRTGIVLADFPDGHLIQRITEQNSFMYVGTVYDMRPAHVDGLAKCVQVPAADGASARISTSSGSGTITGSGGPQQLQQWDCDDGSPAQRFTFVLYNASGSTSGGSVSDGYQQYAEIRAAEGALCLGVDGASKENGAGVVAGACGSGGAGGDSPAQWFVPLPVDGGFAFMNVNSGKCVDLTGWSKENGAALQQWDCSLMGNQVFKLRHRMAAF
ncbi:hypothetical protein PLESTM_001533500 [Pleodorina starrii]|nr:hypothetical protein PLESTM_001533500 [Pleodorina starrii]